MKKCTKPIPAAKNGVARGTCAHPLGHLGRCGNCTCPLCGVKKTTKNSSPSKRLRNGSPCKICYLELSRAWTGCAPKKRQIPGQPYMFPCGCCGTLPARGQSNAFARYNGSQFTCRVVAILNAGHKNCKNRGYVPVSPQTPHKTIREMMKCPHCERCKLPLSWESPGMGRTPHLHHNHATGEIYGFTHPTCNPPALEREIDRLKALLIGAKIQY
jgi:hypothetical protein